MAFFGKSKLLKKPGDYEHAYQYALFLLNLSLRTEEEMRSKMETRGYFSDIIKTVIKKLKEERLIDDERYIEIFIDNMKLYKHYGVFMMKKKSILKKLPKELVEAKLAELVTEEDERKIAKSYVEREFGTIAEIRILPYEAKQKVLRRLISRGFRINVVMNLIK